MLEPVHVAAHPITGWIRRSQNVEQVLGSRQPSRIDNPQIKRALMVIKGSRCHLVLLPVKLKQVRQLKFNICTYPHH